MFHSRRRTEQDKIALQTGKIQETMRPLSGVCSRASVWPWATMAVCTMLLTANSASGDPWTVEAKPVAPEPIPATIGANSAEDGKSSDGQASQQPGKDKSRTKAESAPVPTPTPAPASKTGTRTRAQNATNITKKPLPNETANPQSDQTSRLMKMIGVGEKQDQSQDAEMDNTAGIITLHGASALLNPAEFQATPAEAEFAQDPGLAAYLGALNWGDASREVMAKFEQALWNEYDRVRVTLPNVEDVDRLRSETIARIDTIKANYLKFEKNKTEYRTSIIDGKFARGTSEAVLRVDDPETQTYYFFVADKLWKMVVAFNINVARETPFNEFIKVLAQSHGQPLTVNYSNGSRKKRILSDAIWRDGITELKVENKTELFGTYIMELTDQGWIDRITAMRNRLSKDSKDTTTGGKTAKGDADTRPAKTMTETMMEEATSTEGHQAAPEDIVDQLIQGSKKNND